MSQPAPIAYFCAEFGIDHNLPIYAGGLGVLAGDTIKAAAEMEIPFIGVGLLYRGQKAKQVITDEGKQTEADMDFDPLEVGLQPVYHQAQPLFIKIHLQDHFVWARVWEKRFNDQVRLLLLDTDTHQNKQEDRDINDALYFGDPDKQLKQQFILGIGGIKILAKLRIKPKVYHLNEGRPAFMFWQLARLLMQRSNLDYYQAFQKAKKQLVNTNHTLVAAGNYFIPVDELKTYADFYAKEMEISVDELLAPGLAHDQAGGFSMTGYSLRIAHRHSGVSHLHTKLSQQIWPEYDWQPITNGVHLETWQDQRFKKPDLSDDDIWQIHMENKRQLEQFVRERTGYGYDPNRLVIGWARRLAGYKRLDAIFADIDRLARIMKEEGRSVQLLVAGKAHQEDSRGKELLHNTVKYMANQLSGHALFVPDYNLEVARYLTSGSDVWLNIPERGKEACGTSGMKAISNGVVQCTTSDGWADEVEWFEKGWLLESDNVSHHFYETMENEIKPMFFNDDRSDWIKMMRNSIELSESFSAKRMIHEYQEKLYDYS